MVKERFEFIKEGEMIIIHNSKKLKEGILVYYNDKGELESCPFKLAKLSKMKAKRYLNNQNLKRGYKDGKKSA